jgi:hypothetical protein
MGPMVVLWAALAGTAQDVDGDGVPSVLAGGDDCNDRDPRVNPRVLDRDGDGIDADCGGSDRRDRPLAPAEWWQAGWDAVSDALTKLRYPSAGTGRPPR